ncbi:Lymphocyte antigen 86 [Manis javanica]|nr:Lymphocyte antigen 86 [Manis javanica]
MNSSVVFTKLLVKELLNTGLTDQGHTMKGFTAAFLIWTLISPNGGGKAWPTHTACRDGSLEVLYESCDPLQDFGFSVDECSKQLKSNINIRFGIILREDIKELFLDIALFSKGSSILNFSYPVCEDDLPKFSFCGRRKGEQIYYAGPINNPGFEVLTGEYQVLLQLYNGNHSTVACANATIICS